MKTKHIVLASILVMGLVAVSGCTGSDTEYEEPGTEAEEASGLEIVGCPNAPVAVEGNAWEYDGTQLRLIARNNAGQEITVTEAVSEEGSWTGSETLAIGENSDEITISGMPEVESGDAVDVDIEFTYDGALDESRSACNLIGEA